MKKFTFAFIVLFAFVGFCFAQNGLYHCPKSFVYTGDGTQQTGNVTSITGANFPKGNYNDSSWYSHVGDDPRHPDKVSLKNVTVSQFKGATQNTYGWIECKYAVPNDSTKTIFITPSPQWVGYVVSPDKSKNWNASGECTATTNTDCSFVPKSKPE